MDGLKSRAWAALYGEDLAKVNESMKKFGVFYCGGNKQVRKALTTSCKEWGVKLHLEDPNW